ncbi:MAG TPA: hypothetical protein VMX38_05760, partial [Verrucomicrobiae bacterium]|nr:hypothetical protein [Verrucomicrobiae bacterium]
ICQPLPELVRGDSCTVVLLYAVLGSRALLSIYRRLSGSLASPDCRQGLSRWRGGRYRVVNPDISGTADVVWVTEKGDSRDPFTKNHAGRTPAPQLLCNHDAQLPAGRG